MAATLRRADASDLPSIVRLMNLGFRGTGLDAGGNTEADFIRGERTSDTLLGAEVAASNGGFFLVSDGSAGSGLRACVWLEPLSADTWYLGSLTVHPRLQNAGVPMRGDLEFVVLEKVVA